MQKFCELDQRMADVSMWNQNYSSVVHREWQVISKFPERARYLVGPYLCPELFVLMQRS